MSELLNKKNRSCNFRRNLLANVSMFALLGYLGASQDIALAAIDDDPPTLWIELGGQADRLDGLHQVFAPPFVDKASASDRDPMVDAQRPSPFSIGGEGKISFEPHNTNWVFSAAVRYGRGDNGRHLHQQTAPPYVYRYFGTQIFGQPNLEQFGDGQADFKESHFIADFQAGKDVGLGLFGTRGTSIISAGVRFAQFISKSDVTLHARPEYKFGAFHSGKKYFPRAQRSFGYRTVDVYRHTYTATLRSTRNTHAIGPSLSWDASLPVAGNGSDMSLNFDWGLNAAVLFGRQHTRTHHQTSGHYFATVGNRYKYPYRVQRHSDYALGPYDHDRSRTIMIPNIGGTAAVSLKFSNIHFSLGYRVDLFFGAVDTGIDTAHRQNSGFYGPFATISFGF